MDWEKIGYQAGLMGSLAFFQNQHDRWMDKGREALKKLQGVQEADKTNAEQAMRRAIGSEYEGKDPAALMLAAKKDWMQADNDARYLLNHGYAENSKEVQGFRQLQQRAHERAEGLRYGESMQSKEAAQMRTSAKKNGTQFKIYQTNSRF